jgi:hypothetical protein
MNRRSIPLAVLMTVTVAFVFWAAPVAALEPESGDPRASGGSLGLVLLLTLGSTILWWFFSTLSRSARSWLSVFLRSPNRALPTMERPEETKAEAGAEEHQEVDRKERHERLLR